MNGTTAKSGRWQENSEKVASQEEALCSFASCNAVGNLHFDWFEMVFYGSN